MIVDVPVERRQGKGKRAPPRADGDRGRLAAAACEGQVARRAVSCDVPATLLLALGVAARSQVFVLHDNLFMLSIF